MKMKVWRYCVLIVLIQTLYILRSPKVYILGNDNIEEKTILNQQADLQRKCIILQGVIERRR